MHIIPHQGLLPRKYKELPQLNSKKPTQLKIGQMTISSKERIHVANKQEKILHIISFQRNAKQDHNEIAFHIHQDSYNQKTDNNKYWYECGETAALIHY